MTAPSLCQYYLQISPENTIGQRRLRIAVNDGESPDVMELEDGESLVKFALPPRLPFRIGLCELVDDDELDIAWSDEVISGRKFDPMAAKPVGRLSEGSPRIVQSERILENSEI
ncbi:hypothetical protein [Rosistilla oblonga]|uniref:hypothetical protein n=1 Tax=Rosistilla oblonga TaxID=2527990 RepID=UPI003A968CE6